MIRFFKTSALCAALLVLGAAAHAQEFVARCIKVSDGDTITVLDESRTPPEQIKIRLYGIDAPESKQDFGRRSREHLAAMVANHVLTVQELSKDRYGRSVARLWTEAGLDVNRQMVADGMAWVYVQYCKDDFCREWAALEAQARQNKFGLWRQRATAPWEWRKAQRVAKQAGR